MKALISLPISILRENFTCDFETGRLFWKKSNGVTKVGSVARSRNSDGSLQVSINDKHYQVHRVIFAMWYGRWPKAELDHINRIKTDNRISNLREASRAQNSWNGHLKPGRTGFRGVKLHKGKFQTAIKVGGKRIHLGTFETPEEAHKAYKKAVTKYHKEFAYVE